MDVTLSAIEGSKKLQTVTLRSEETIVGRRAGCDLRIPVEALSRRHCRLSFRGDLLTVEDLASANGTFINGERVTQAEIVRPGDKLGIGPVTFLVEYSLTEAAKAKLAELPPRDAIAEMEAAVIEDEDVVLEGVEAAEEEEEVLQGVVVEDDEQETVRDADADTDFDFSEEKPKKKKKKSKAREEENPDASEVMRDWEGPHGGELRDILEQLGDGKKG